MILRGFPLADSRRALNTVSPLGAINNNARSLHAHGSNEESVVADQTVIGSMPLAAPDAVLDRRPKLTLDVITDWLKTQDSETRQICAATLTDDLNAIYGKAKTDGFSVGERTAIEAHDKKIASMLAILQELTASAESAFSEERQRLQDICVDVVSTVLAKIAGPLLATKEAALSSVVEVLARVEDERELTIRVSHEDVATLRAHTAELTSALQGRAFNVVADSRVDLGGCIAETKLGSLDGRLEVQLRELFETLKHAKLAARDLK
jgi:flagellar biosynthesis/type III secretory pathway protein FliH